METVQALRALEAIVGPSSVLASRAERTVYTYDASVFRGRDLLAVVFPQSAEQVAALVVWCKQHGQAYIARGAGMSISGGSIPTHGGLMIELSHMNRVLEIDTVNRFAVVEPGVINVTGNPGCLLQLRQGVKRHQLDVEVMHPIEVLAQAYAPATPAPTHD